MKYTISFLFASLVTLSISTAEANKSAYPYTDHNGDRRYVNAVKIYTGYTTSKEYKK
jgi:hypothetical protein